MYSCLATGGYNLNSMIHINDQLEVTDFEESTDRNCYWF